MAHNKSCMYTKYRGEIFMLKGKKNLIQGKAENAFHYKNALYFQVSQKSLNLAEFNKINK